MVATTQRTATDAGLEMLRAGGTAADAVVAAAAALAITEPMMTGLGGDCFALYYEGATGKLTALNGSGRAPARLGVDLVRSRGLTRALTVTVPGACAGWCDLLARHGRFSIGRVLEPAIRLAEDGFTVAPWAALAWADGLAMQRLLEAPGHGRSLLVDGKAPRQGDTFRNTPLARALRAIAAHGGDAFYRGPIADAIVATVQGAGGVMDPSDLVTHTSTWDEPIATEYRGHRIWECPPNNQGLVALLALDILEGFELRGMDPLGPQRLHLVTEALRLAFADARAFLGDPRQAPVPVAALLSKEYAATRRALIRPARALRSVPHGAPRGGSDTVYLCAVDSAGNACSFINSIFAWFGSGLVPGAGDADPGWGFCLQNRGASFVLEPGHPDVVAPGKRPYHTIMPGMVTRADGTLYGPFGVMGGFMQPQGHVQVITSLLDDGTTPQAALDRPRLCVRARHPAATWPEDASAVELHLEQGIAPATVAALAAMGHTVVGNVAGAERLLFGRGQVIRRSSDGSLEGGSDPRGDDGHAGMFCDVDAT
jgi:gamma-glutamyltranspeptidase/glutathione hydrolase